MLLSYNKPVEVSSELAGYPKKNAVDEEIRTYWSAQTGNKGEWISIDLEKECIVNAIQVNFAENQTQLQGCNPQIYYQYLLEYSNDAKTWKTLADKTANKADVPHDFIQLAVPVKALYIRLTNYYVPDGNFAIAGLRLFGSGQGSVPGEVKNFKVVRTPTDRREVVMNWDQPKGALGYNIHYGTHPKKLYLTHQVIGNNTLTIRSLNSTLPYWFTIEAFNENGVTSGVTTIKAD